MKRELANWSVGMPRNIVKSEKVEAEGASGAVRTTKIEFAVKCIDMNEPGNRNMMDYCIREGDVTYQHRHPVCFTA